MEGMAPGAGAPRSARECAGYAGEDGEKEALAVLAVGVAIVITRRRKRAA